MVVELDTGIKDDWSSRLGFDGGRARPRLDRAELDYLLLFRSVGSAQRE
jgi:hypothetical protein